MILGKKKIIKTAISVNLELCTREEQSQLGFVESRSCQRRVVPSALRNGRESRVLEVDFVLLTGPQKTFSCWMCGDENMWEV